MGDAAVSISRRLRELREKLRGGRGAIGRPAVPRHRGRDLPPPGEYRLAWEYLNPDSHLKRREITIDAYLSGTDERSLAVECVLPEKDIGDHAWYLPVAFLERGDVAPFLRVTDGDGAIVPIPTKPQNMALTMRAIRELLAAKKIEPDSNAVLDLIEEIVTRPPARARICHLVLERESPEVTRVLGPLLSLLEDHFLLWVPIRGEPLSHLHLHVARRQIRLPDELFRRKTKTAYRRVHTPVGSVRVRWQAATGRWTPNRKLALERLLHLFALRPVEAYVDELEAARFSSCHLCFRAPDGFLVRYIKSAELAAGEAGSPPGYRRLSRHQRDVAIQGYDQDLAHLHVSKPRNSTHIHTRLTVGLRGGITTLWMLATVLTAALLWVIHHHSRYGPVLGPDQGHPRLVLDALTAPVLAAREHARESTVGADNRQIAAAALLVGPAFASAWSLRGEGGTLLRSSLAGSRVLLLLSAALSVAAALALADILPSASGGRYQAVEIYAAASYVVAVPMVIAWLLASRPLWVIFRSALRSERSNLQAVAILSAPILAIGSLPFAPGRIEGAVLLACGVGLALVSGNSVAEPLFDGRTLYRPLAGLGSLLPLAIAGVFLGFYADWVRPVVACAICSLVGVVLLSCSIWRLYGGWRVPEGRPFMAAQSHRADPQGGRSERR